VLSLCCLCAVLSFPSGPTGRMSNILYVSLELLMMITVIGLVLVLVGSWLAGWLNWIGLAMFVVAF